MNPLQRLVEAAAKKEALDKVGDRLAGVLQKTVDKVPQSAKVQDFLHGAWLGHPLHPILTDVPIGAWTFAALLDATDLANDERNPAAEKAIQFGMLAAVPTALAGAVDWQHTYGGSRRVGVVHALLNSGGLGMFGLSLALRGSNLAIARMLSLGGIAMVGVSGYFGGHLVANMRVGVKHEAEPAGDPSFFSEASVQGELLEDTPRRVEVDGTPLVMVRHRGAVYALADVCPHLGCSLAEGSISDDAIVCGCHGSTFALEDGRVIHGPSAFPVQVYHPSLPGVEVNPGPALNPGME
jgi:nitrite reductase/ring-hydroxylating ferredoxin subunit/uncharacterized membrane protein